MGSLSPVHWIVVIVVVLLLFGPRRLAAIGQGLGQGLRELRKGLAEVRDAEESYRGARGAVRPKRE